MRSQTSKLAAQNAAITSVNHPHCVPVTAETRTCDTTGETNDTYELALRSVVTIGNHTIIACREKGPRVLYNGLYRMTNWSLLRRP